MIQRIQSVYLLISVLAMGLLLLFPLTEYVVNDQCFVSYLYGIENSGTLNIPVSVWLLFCFHLILSVLPLIIIFLYRNRLLQMKLCRIEFLLLILEVGLLFLVYPDYIIKPLLGGIAVINYSPSIFLVLIAMAFVYIAFRKIRKDEWLVRAANRIR